MNVLHSRSVVALLLTSSVALGPARSTAQLAGRIGDTIDSLPSAAYPAMIGRCAALYEEAERVYGVDNRFIEAKRARESAADARAALLHLLRSAAARAGHAPNDDELNGEAATLVREAKQSIYKVSPPSTDSRTFWAEVQACDASNVLRQFSEAARGSAQQPTPAAPATPASR